jgi:hypothetical protein
VDVNVNFVNPFLRFVDLTPTKNDYARLSALGPKNYVFSQAMKNFGMNFVGRTTAFVVINSIANQVVFMLLIEPDGWSASATCYLIGIQFI